MLGISPGPGELLVIGIIALLLFGKRLPEVARNVGKGLSEFKKSMSGFENEIRSSTRETERRIDYNDDSSNAADADDNKVAQTVPDDDDDDFGAPQFKVQD